MGVTRFLVAQFDALPGRIRPGSDSDGHGFIGAKLLRVPVGSRGRWVFSFLTNFIGAHPVEVLILLFALDAFGFPSLPEVATLIVFFREPSWGWGLGLLGLIVAVQVIASWVLYRVVRRFGLPSPLQRLMRRYANLLLIHNERLLLVNRFVPVLPFAAAFIPVLGWKVRRSFAYIALGAAVKYAALLALSGVAFNLVQSEVTLVVTIAAVLLFLALSWLVTLHRRRNPKSTLGVAPSAVPVADE